MKIPRKPRRLVRIALLTSVAHFSHTDAASIVTTYSTGDMFIGFRQEGVASTLAVDIGSFSKFLPSTYAGGTWSGNPFQVQFGTIPPGNPGAGTPVFSLSTDLTAVFGANWATNDLENGTNDVSWAVLGQTSNTSDNSPTAGLTKRSVFQTIARTDPNVVADAPLNFSNGSFAVEFNSFAQGTAGGNAYKGRFSTENSSTAYAGPASDANNWGARIGGSLSGSTFGSGTLGEQPFSGLAAGPTNSTLDLFLIPNEGSTLVTAPTYLGSFVLGTGGQLTYFSVPEPGSFTLLVGGIGLLGMSRRRNYRANGPAVSNTPRV